MVRLACVDASAFPLQLWLREHPAWRELPAAVVARDAPQGVLLWVNEAARRAGILPGATYAAGLALDARLVAGVLENSAVARGVEHFTGVLREFSPAVEPDAREPGVFWVDAAGLNLLYPSLEAWTRALCAGIEAQGFTAAVAVGFRRFASYAAAKVLGGSGFKLCADLAEESQIAASVELSRLGLEPRVRDELAALGVVRLADFVRLPSGGVLERYGELAHRLHRAAVGEGLAEFAPLAPEVPIRASLDFEEALVSVGEIAAAIEELAPRLLRELAGQDRAAAAVHVRLELDGASPKRIDVAATSPTLELARLQRLVGLRLERVALARGVTRLELELTGVQATREQLRLFLERPRRDLAAAARALDALRATFGEDAVTRAVLVDKHLPEASFAWQRLERVDFPRSSANGRPTLVRRIFARARALPPRSKHAEDGWLLAGVTRGPVQKLVGPYALSGAWWRAEIRRDYYFAELASGEWLWVYFDRARRRWFWQGSVS